MKYIIIAERLSPTSYIKIQMYLIKMYSYLQKYKLALLLQLLINLQNKHVTQKIA